MLCLELTREVIAAALARLRMRHAEQVNLPIILRGARFNYYHHGTRLPTGCPNRIRGSVCACRGSFCLLLICYDLRRRLAEVPEAIEFVILMAKRTETATPQKPRPRYIEN